MKTMQDFKNEESAKQYSLLKAKLKELKNKSNHEKHKL